MRELIAITANDYDNNEDEIRLDTTIRYLLVSIIMIIIDYNLHQLLCSTVGNPVVAIPFQLSTRVS